MSRSQKIQGYRRKDQRNKGKDQKWLNRMFGAEEKDIVVIPQF